MAIVAALIFPVSRAFAAASAYSEAMEARIAMAFAFSINTAFEEALPFSSVQYVFNFMTAV